MRVLYVGGWMRSGTTLVGDLAGASPDAVALGEVSGVWGEALRGTCQCGLPIPECPLWARVFEAVEARHDLSLDQVGGFAGVVRGVLRTRRFPRLAALRADDPQAWPDDVRRVVDVTRTMVDTVARTTGAAALVDTSKLPPLMQIYRLAGVEALHVVQPVRDPRAVAASENRTRAVRPGESTTVPPGRAAARSALMWSLSNVAVAMAGRRATTYERLAFDDLVSDPRAVMEATLGRIGLAPPEWVDGRPDTSGNHQAVGNPARFTTGHQGVMRSVPTPALDLRDRLAVEVLSSTGRAVLAALPLRGGQVE